MLQLSFDDLLKKMISETDKEEEEILKLISEKRKDLKDLVSREGAAYIVAQELNLELTPKKTKEGFTDLDKLVGGLRNVNVVGRVSNIYPIREFSKGGGGKVVNLLIVDGKKSSRVTLWNDKVKLIEKKDIELGDVLGICNAYTKLNNFNNLVEVHAGTNTTFNLNPDLDNPIPEIDKTTNDGEEINQKPSFTFSGVVVHIFDLKTFNFCNECNKKTETNSCDVGNEHPVLLRGLFSFVVDNGTESFRVVAFNEMVEKFLKKPINENNDIVEELFLDKKKELLGSFVKVEGRKKMNTYNNKDEIVAMNIDFDIDFKQVLEQKLEKH